MHVSICECDMLYTRPYFFLQPSQCCYRTTAKQPIHVSNTTTGWLILFCTGTYVVSEWGRLEFAVVFNTWNSGPFLLASLIALHAEQVFRNALIAEWAQKFAPFQPILKARRRKANPLSPGNEREKVFSNLLVWLFNSNIYVLLLCLSEEQHLLYQREEKRRKEKEEKSLLPFT